MKFDPPLVSGRLHKRYKRFLSDIRLDTGEEITAHCANPGSMMGLAEEGSRVWLSKSDNPKRKLAYSWELVETAPGGRAGINTGKANAIVEEALAEGRIPELAGYETCRREVKYGTGSRIDLLLEDPEKPPAYVEIKSVTLSRKPGIAEFPDAVTARGAKHMEELARRAVAGDRAIVFFLVQRTDAESFRVAEDIDPGYAKAFQAAVNAGVEALCYTCDISPEEIRLNRKLNL